MVVLCMYVLKNRDVILFLQIRTIYFLLFKQQEEFSALNRMNTQTKPKIVLACILRYCRF